MKYPNQDPPIPVHRGWAEHRAAKERRILNCYGEAVREVVVFDSDREPVGITIEFLPLKFAQPDAVKIERAKPDRIERRKILKAERKSKKALKTHGSLGAVRTPFDKKADWPDLPNPNANRDKEWAKARREAKKAQKERAIQLRLAG